MRRLAMMILAGLMAATAWAQDAPAPEKPRFTWWNEVPELIRRGNEAYFAENYEQAEAAYRDAQLKRPGAASAAFNMGLAQGQRGEHDAAAASFARALNLAREDEGLRADALYNLGVARLKQALAHEEDGKRDQAIESTLDALDAFEETLRRNPEHEDAEFNRRQAQRFLEFFSMPPPPQQQQQQQGDGAQQQQQPQDQQQQQQQQGQAQEQPEDGEQQDQPPQEGQQEQQEQEQQQQQSGQQGQQEQQDQQGTPQDQQEQEQDGDKQQQGNPRPQQQQMTEEQARQLLNLLGDEQNIQLRQGRRSGVRPDPAKDW